MEKEAKPVIIANYAEYHCTKKNVSPDIFWSIIQICKVNNN